MPRDTMTNREEQFEQLSAYLDGELTADEALDLEAALQTDEVLQAELESLRQTRQLLRQLPPETAPDHFAHGVMARAEKRHYLGKSNPAGMYRSWRWIQLATAAVVLMAAGLGLIVITQMHPPPEAEPFVATGPEPGAMDLAERRDAASAWGGSAESPMDDTAAGVVEAEGLAARAAPSTMTSPPVSPTMPVVLTEVIYTDDLLLARQQVEAVLADNRITPAEWADDEAMAAPGLAKLNSYQTTRVDEQQIQLVVNVEVGQVERLRRDLTNFRNRQTVSQTAGEDDGPDYVRKDAGGEIGPVLTIADGPAEATVPPEPDESPDGVAASRSSTATAATTWDMEETVPVIEDKLPATDADKAVSVADRADAVAAQAGASAQPASLPEGVPDFSDSDVAPDADDNEVRESDRDRLAEGAASGERPDATPPRAMQQVVITLNRSASPTSPVRRATPSVEDGETESRN